MAHFLVLGGGGREHALAWKLATSPACETVYCCPGNGGTAMEPKTQNIQLDWRDTNQLLAFIRAKDIAVTVVGPEDPLVAGLADRLRAASHFCFGPSAAAAQLEGSKSFCKDFLHQHQIPTAAYEVFDDYAKAGAYLDECSYPCVVKFDGLAAGKGVTVAADIQTARAALDDIYKHNKFNPALGTNGKHKVVIEEFLDGQELSFIVAAHGTKCQPLASAQDHKARDEGDQGPNTGGMGAFTPVAWADELRADLLTNIIQPTLTHLARAGTPYCGFLYAGLMIKNKRAQVLEFNCRLGDPEAQALLFGMETDLAEWLLRLKAGEDLAKLPLKQRDQFVVTVVMAAGGYPGDYARGHAIEGLATLNHANTKVFQAGTRLEGKRLLTNGGRVLAVTAQGGTLTAAQHHAYDAVRTITWPDVFYRTDIGSRPVPGAND